MCLRLCLQPSRQVRGPVPWCCAFSASFNTVFSVILAVQKSGPQRSFSRMKEVNADAAPSFQPKPRSPLHFDIESHKATQHLKASSLVLLKSMLIHHHPAITTINHAARVHTFPLCWRIQRQRGALELLCLLVDPSFCLFRLPMRCCVQCAAPPRESLIRYLFLFPFPEHGPNLAPTVSLAGRAASCSHWFLYQPFSRVTTINFLAPEETPFWARWDGYHWTLGHCTELVQHCLAAAKGVDGTGPLLGWGR